MNYIILFNSHTPAAVPRENVILPVAVIKYNKEVCFHALLKLI